MNKYIKVLHIYLFVDKRTRLPVGFMRGNHQARLVPNARKDRKFKKFQKYQIETGRIWLVGWRDFAYAYDGILDVCECLWAV